MKKQQRRMLQQHPYMTIIIIFMMKTMMMVKRFEIEKGCGWVALLEYAFFDFTAKTKIISILEVIIFSTAIETVES